VSGIPQDVVITVVPKHHDVILVVERQPIFLVHIRLPHVTDSAHSVDVEARAPWVFVETVDALQHSGRKLRVLLT
jgi:hypothetical protein